MENALDINLTAQEVFVLAQKIEKKAEQFYLQAAGAAGDPITQQLFLSLAVMEKLHAQVFDGMGAPGGDKRLEATAPVKDKYREIWPMLAGTMIQDIDKELPKFFKGRHSSEDIIRAAMDFERDTIVLFYGIREMMSGPTDRQRLDDIMKEEMGHLISLGSQLACLGQA
jgi:rubrerythrin